MSFLRGSANYVWCTTSVLGKGATGAVFQGINKHTGETVAVKTFNQLSHMRPQEVQMREFEVLRKVKHENIVKLLAIEEEQDGKGRVIVMELCTGGSLFNILDDPENSDGLDEDEFLTVLEHLTAGMKHLRDNNLVHRDLKPGNIMKYIAIDGTTVYKLTDFGAARELEDGQQFVSLYGTEEYLHPDMYERAVLRKPVGKTFGATVDLWSIGVTLYHVATGNLPFRPFGGRRNKETMYYITAKKLSGVISGIQNSENGEIIWSRELPDTCLLSLGLKKIVTPLFAGLMEVDALRMWNFDRFFEEVTTIISKKPAHFFYVNSLHSLRVYLSPSECSEVSSLIEEQTGMTCNNQLLLTKTSHQWSDQESFPSSVLDSPLFIFNRDNNNIFYESKDVSVKYPPFSATVSVETDASTAKQCCSVGFGLKRRIEVLVRSFRLMDSAVHALSGWLIKELQCLYGQTMRCEEQLQSWNKQLHIWQKLHFLTKEFIRFLPSDELNNWNLLDNILQSAKSQHSDVANQMTILAPSVKQLYQRVVRDESLAQEWPVFETASTNPLSTICGKASTYVSRLKDSWQHLLRDRAARVLSYNDEQFHLLERIKMTETFKSLESLLLIECVPTVKNTAELLADWYKMAQAVVLQTEILSKDVSTLEVLWEEVSKNQERLQASYFSKLTELLDVLKGKHNNTISYTQVNEESKTFEAPSLSNKAINKGLQNLQTIHEDVIKLVEENAQILYSLFDLILKFKRSKFQP
nr:EOG090X01SN [Scapholeberis mucronata]